MTDRGRKCTAPIALAVIALGACLCGCSPFAGYVADHWPHWAGGMPADVPPRPGAPGYDDFISHGGAQPAKPATDKTDATSATTPAATTPAAPVAAAAPRPTPVVSAPAAAPEPASPGEPADDRSAVRGGLY